MANTRNRGFASMDEQKQRQIASKGGKAAHEQGTAHEFTPDEARLAGRKGGEAVSKNRQHMAAIGRLGGEASRGSRRAKAANGGSGNAELQTQATGETGELSASQNAGAGTMASTNGSSTYGNNPTGESGGANGNAGANGNSSANGSGSANGSSTSNGAGTAHGNGNAGTGASLAGGAGLNGGAEGRSHF